MLFSILFAVYLAKTDVLIRLLSTTAETELVGTFIAGLFFTSIFTTAPAIATLGELAQSYSLFQVAFLGAIGAVMGDLLIFRFVKDRFSVHLLELFRGGGQRFKKLLRLKLFRLFTFVLGGFIIASPLPDELGVSLMGFSKMKMSLFIPLAFLFNFLGIVLVGLAARALV